jgi:hypothetical protein
MSTQENTTMGMPTNYPFTQAQPTPQFANPMFDPNIQSSIAQQQIQFLIQQMEQYHMGNQQLMVTIKNAMELNKANNTQAAAALLYEIIQRPDRTKDDADNYTVFLSQIQQLGQTLMQTLSIQYSAAQMTNGGGGYEEQQVAPQYMNYQEMNQGMGMQSGMNGGNYQTQSVGMGMMNGGYKPTASLQQPQQVYFGGQKYPGKDLSDGMKFK